MAEHPRIQRLFLYDEGDMSLRDFVELTPDQLRQIVQFVDSQGYSGERDEILKLAEKIGRSYEKTADILQYSAYLYGERNRLGLTADDMLVEFETFLGRKGQSELRQKLSAISSELRQLFSDRPDVALRAKKASVTTGIVPAAIDFYSLCDLRPVFNESRDTILEYVPVALVRVLVRSDTQEESPLIFQMDQNGVSRLEAFLDRLRKKMAVLEQARNELAEQKKK